MTSIASSSFWPVSIAGIDPVVSPLLLLAAYTAGILIGDNSSLFPFFFLLLPCALLLLYLLLCQRKRTAFILLCALATCLGIALYDLNRYPLRTDDHLLALSDGPALTIDGRIVATAARSPSGYVIDVQSSRLIAKTGEAALSGRLRLFVEKGENRWNPGDDIRFSSKLKSPRLFGTPGEYDLGRQLALHNIFVTAFVPESAEILLLRPAAPEERSWIERGRTATGRFIDAQIPSLYSPLVKALAIGDKGGLSPELVDLLARGGVSHLFAISGLHLALVALALYGIALTLYRRSTRLLLLAPPARILPLLIAPLLILYLLWTGIGVSTQRALLMVLSGSFLFLLRRRTDPMNLLAFSAFAILLCQPLALFTPSFQLSFAALAGILGGSRIWSPALAGRAKALQYLGALFFSSLFATLATLPLVLYHFNLIAPGGVVTNLFAIPVISWVGVPLALAGSLLWPLFPQVAIVLLKGCEAVIVATLKITALIIALPGLSGWRLYPSLAIIAILSLLTIAIFIPAKPALPRWLLVAAALLLFLWGLRAPEELSVTALSVGQGESLLVSLGPSNFLVDGGGLYGDRLDIGRQLVAPALGRLGIHHLDGVILTHNHPDHAKGLITLLADIPCAKVIVGAPLANGDPLLNVLRDRRIPLEVAGPGWAPCFQSDSAQLFIFRPLPTASKDENDRSLVLYARSQGQGALLTGDLGEIGMQSLMANPPPGAVTLCKLPHHGSERSRPAPLIAFLQPRLAFVSVGDQNRFNLPDLAVKNYLAEQKIPLFRTDRDGTLRFIAGADDWKVEKLQTGFLIDTTIATLLQICRLSIQERSRPK